MILDPNDIQSTVFEPVLQNRFIFYADGIPSYLVKSIDGIGYESSEFKIDYINSYFKGLAKVTYNDINISLYNPISPSGAQILEQKSRLAYERLTGRHGYMDMYQFDATVNILGPAGDIVGEWIFKRASIKSAKYGSYDYASENYVTMDIVLQVNGIDLDF